MVDIDLPAPEPRLVVNSIFTPDSLWEVRLSSSSAYSDTAFAEGPWVNDAVVEIWQGNQQVDMLENLNNGRYRGKTQPEGERDYTIRVSAPGWTSVEGQGRVPQAGIVESIRARYVDIEDNSEFFDDGKIEVTVTINDLPGVDNYFNIRVIRDWVQITSDTLIVGDVSYSSFATQDLLLTEDGIRDHFFTKAYFTDDLFKDGAYELNIEIETANRIEPIGTYTESYFIELLTLSEEMYFYQISADLQRSTDQDPFTEPVDVYSNMSSGFGIFAGYHAQMFEINVEG